MGPLFPSVCVLMLSGAATAAPPGGHSRAAIIDGVPAPADSAVVGIGRPGGGEFLCTGTLISRHVVLTAGHCLGPGVSVAVVFRAQPGDDRTIAGASTRVHPAYVAASLENDLGLVLLSEAAPAEVSPLRLARQAPRTGETARFVGFGFSQIGPSGTYGERRETATSITQVASTTFRYGVATCEGDSGGPAFVRRGAAEELAGVTSSGDSVCGVWGLDTRVDPYVAWIDGVISTVDPLPVAPPSAGCSAAPLELPLGAVLLLLRRLIHRFGR